MSFVAKIEARAYSRATEVPERVVAAILNLYPEEYREIVELETTKAEGHSGDKIVVFESQLKHRVGCEATLDYIFANLGKEDRRRLHNTLQQRIDKNCFFFVRIDKQAAFLGDIVIAKGPDIISVQVHIQQYPRCKQENVIAMLRDRLGVSGGED